MNSGFSSFLADSRFRSCLLRTSRTILVFLKIVWGVFKAHTGLEPDWRQISSHHLPNPLNNPSCLKRQRVVNQNKRSWKKHHGRAMSRLAPGANMPLWGSFLWGNQRPLKVSHNTPTSSGLAEYQNLGSHEGSPGGNHCSSAWFSEISTV